MSKKGKTTVYGELTIYDFANAKTPRGKCKKSIVSSMHVAKQHQMFDNDDDVDDEDLEVSFQQKTKKSNKKKKQHSEDHVYNDYHVDIWFLVSEYIRPEDVGRFALICKKTDEVVASAKFWSNMYKRYYSPSIKLPQHLQPDCLGPSGLRAKVISSLFYTYPPFAARINAPINLDTLQNFQLLTTWFNKLEDKTWMICYRFSNRIKTRKPPRQDFLRCIKNSKKSNKDGDDDDDWFENCCDEFIAQYNNIFHNPTEGNHLLVIFTKHFVPSPIFYGQKVFLNSIRQPIAHGLRTFNLELKFSNYRNEIISTIIYDSIIKTRIINWWHPDFQLFLNL